MLKLSTISLAFLLITNFNLSAQEGVDEAWDEISRTVAEGDFEGYAATYHPDAILVNGISETSYPIADALAGWKQGFIDTKAGIMTASVEFKFTQRLHSETTAFDTGIFKYVAQVEGGEPNVVLIHFQGLLTKASGVWKLMMENQISIATEEEWETIK